MANSIFIPLLRMPLNLSAVRIAIDLSLSEFSLPPARVWLDTQDSVPASLTDGFIVVEGQPTGPNCRVHVDQYSSDMAHREQFLTIREFHGYVCERSMHIWREPLKNARLSTSSLEN